MSWTQISLWLWHHYLQGCNGDEYDGDNLLAIKCPSIVSPSSKEGSARSSSSSTSSCPPAQLMTRKTGPSSFAYFHLQHFPNFTKPRFSIFPLDKIRDDIPKYPGAAVMGESFVEVQLPGCFCGLEGCKHGFWAALLYTTSMANKKEKMPPSYNSTPPPLKGFSDVSSRNKSQIGFHQADLAPSTQFIMYAFTHYFIWQGGAMLMISIGKLQEKA